MPSCSRPRPTFNWPKRRCARYETLLATKAISRQEYDERHSTFDTSHSTVEAAKADVAAGEANVQRLIELQSFSKVYAPFAGTITARSIQLGQLLTSGNGMAQSLFRLAKTDPVRVFVNVPQMYAPGVKVGLPAELVVREMPSHKFIGRVTRTARAIDPTTRTLLTEIQVPQSPIMPCSLVPTCRWQMNVARENPPMLVPAGALVFNASGTSVAVLDGTRHIHFQPGRSRGGFWRRCWHFRRFDCHDTGRRQSGRAARRRGRGRSDLATRRRHPTPRHRRQPRSVFISNGPRATTERPAEQACTSGPVAERTK